MLKRVILVVAIIMTVFIMPSLADGISSEPCADQRIFIYDQGWSGSHNQGSSIQIYHGRRGWGSLANYGCGFYTYLHAYQWLTGTSMNTSNAESLITQMKNGISSQAGTTEWDCRADSYYANYFSGFGIKRSDPSMSVSSLSAHFSAGGVVKTYTPDGGSHYNLAVGLAYGDVDGNGSSEYWVHIIDSSAYSTLKAVESQGYYNCCYSFRNHSSLSYSKLYGNITNNRSEDNGVALEYWMKYDVFSKCTICAGFLPGTIPDPATTLEFKNVSYPKRYKINSGGYWIESGQLVSNNNLLSITTEIRDSSNSLVSGPYTIQLSGKTFNLPGKAGLDTDANGDNGVRFSRISAEGKYTWILTAKDSGGRTLTMPMEFYAYSDGSIESDTKSMSFNEGTTVPTTAYLDVNGWLDATFSGDLGDCGTVDVYINGNLVADDVNDYYTAWPVGTTYEIRDVRASTGYIYRGPHLSNLSGTVDASGTDVELSFDRDAVLPTISDVRVSNISSKGYTVTCTVSDNIGVERVQFPTWYDGQQGEDATWHDGVVSGNTATCYISVSDHGGKTGLYYHTDVYAWDTAGNMSVGANARYNFVPSPTVQVTSIILNMSNLSLDSGDTYTLTATLSPTNATNRNVTWSSSNTSVVTVSGGVVKAVGVGNATITCSAADGSGIKTTCTVTVEEEVIPDFILPSALKEIGEEAFAGIDARSIVVPDGVKTIGKKAFADCVKLEKITIPASAKNIAKDAFANAANGFTIHGSLNSYAQTYASENGIHFVADDACTITFNANGGVSGETSRMIKKGVAIGTLPTASKSNNTLDGWYTSASGGTKVTASTVFSSDTTVYAHWTQNTCTITFNANGGSVSTSSKVVNCAEAVGTLPTPTRTYYTFNGWYTAAFGGTVIMASSTFTSNTTLYAHWTQNGFGGWSDWSTTAVSGNDNREVQTEVRQVQTGTKTTYSYSRYAWKGNYWNNVHYSEQVAKQQTNYKEGFWQYLTLDYPLTQEPNNGYNDRYVSYYMEIPGATRTDIQSIWYNQSIGSEPVYGNVTYYRYRDRIK